MKNHQSFLTKMFLGITMLLMSAFNVSATTPYPGGYQHVIEVARFPHWGKKFLTITDASKVKYALDGKTWKKEYLTHEYVDECKDDSSKHLYRGCLIIEVDGVSAEGWTAAQFYQKVDGRTDVITLKVRERNFNIEPKGIRDFVTKIKARKDVNSELVIFDDAFASRQGKSTFAQRRNGQQFTYEDRYDEDFDFFYSMFYGYKLTSDDPLLDKELIRGMGMMERNEEHPDVLLTVKRAASDNYHTEYVPAQYKTQTSVQNFVVKQQKVIARPGYTQNVRTVDTYLEMTALDARKMKDGNSQELPVVWKAIAKRHTNNAAYDPTSDLKAYATWMTMPIWDRFVSVEKIYAPSGFITDDQDPFIIASVKEGSRADRAGFMAGDQLLRFTDLQWEAFGKTKTFKYSPKDIKRVWGNTGWKLFDGIYYNSKPMEIEFLRAGKKFKAKLEPLSLTVEQKYIAVDEK